VRILFEFSYYNTILPFFVCELRSYFVGCSPTRARKTYAAHIRQATHHASYFLEPAAFSFRRRLVECGVR